MRTLMTAADPDAPLVLRSQAGERAAFEELVRRHARSAARLANRLLGNLEDAEDAVQEAFTRVYRNLHRFRGDASFRTWILHITLHLCHDHLRRRPRRGIPAPADLGIDELPSPGAGPAREASARDEVTALVRALDDLPPRQKAALLLKVYEQLPYEEVAAVLGTSIAAARVYLSMARTSLRRRFERAARRREAGP